MGSSQNKVRLSPRLRLGVGRGFSKQNYLKYSGYLFLVLSLVLTVRTVYVLATKDNNAQVASTPQPQVLGAETNTESSPSFIEYTVKKGDTVFNVSQAHNISWTTLATINGLSSPFTLKVGQTLKIPQ